MLHSISGSSRWHDGPGRTPTSGGQQPSPPVSNPGDTREVSGEEDDSSQSQLDPATMLSGYTVQSGDTLSQIAQQHGISLSALEADNPNITNPNLIFPGQSINLGGGGGATTNQQASGPEAQPTTSQQASGGSGGGGASSGSPVGFIPNGQALEGSHGGQCVVFVENQTGHYFPVASANQMLNPGMHDGYDVTNTARPGEIFVETGGQYGHTGFVDAVNPDGTLTVTDSNYNLDETVHTHTIPASQMAGYLEKSS